MLFWTVVIVSWIFLSAINLMVFYNLVETMPDRESISWATLAAPLSFIVILGVVLHDTIRIRKRNLEETIKMIKD